MKAAIINEFGSPEVFEVKEVTDAQLVKENDVTIEMKASGINPVDWKTRKGNLKMILGSPFPIILGYDAAGIVKKTGSSVTLFQPGDRVHGRLDKKFGKAYAELAVCSENALAKLPKAISFEEGAAIPLASLTALQALRDKGKIKTGQEVLINGASSGVGHYALQLAKYYGAVTTAVCSSRHKKMMDELKPDYHIDYEKIDFTQSEKKYDLIFDVVGKETFLSCKHNLKKSGTYITSLPRPKLLVHKPLAMLLGKKVKTLLMKPLGDDISFMDELILQKKVKSYIDKIYPLEKIAEAHKYSQTGRAEGKIVIKIK